MSLQEKVNPYVQTNCRVKSSSDEADPWMLQCKRKIALCEIEIDDYNEQLGGAVI